MTDVPSSPGIDTAAYEDTDDAEVVKVLAAVRHCANSWDGSARLVGNVRARDISRACTAAIASLQPTGGEEPVEDDANHVWSALKTLSDPLLIPVDGIGMPRLLNLVNRMRDIAATALFYAKPQPAPSSAATVEALKAAEGELTDLARPLCCVFNRATKKYDFSDEHIAKALPGTFQVIQQIRAALNGVAQPSPDAKAVSKAFDHWCWTKDGSPLGMLGSGTAARQAFQAGIEWALALPSAGVAQPSTNPADEIIGQIEARFPNWKSYRDLVDCIDCTLHALRGGR